VMYAMLCGTVPFKASNMKELHKMIIKGKYNLKEEITDEAKSLMRSMLETDPKKRISIPKILQHPWMQIPEEPF
jgi:serine/threonine protein kinase